MIHDLEKNKTIAILGTIRLRCKNPILKFLLSAENANKLSPDHNKTSERFGSDPWPLLKITNINQTCKVELVQQQKYIYYVGCQIESISWIWYELPDWKNFMFHKTGFVRFVKLIWFSYPSQVWIDNFNLNWIDLSQIGTR